MNLAQELTNLVIQAQAHLPKGDPINKSAQPLRGSAVAHGGNPQDRAASPYQ
ncbi:hypothetical protein [Nostoc sp. CALU 546]|uniref:hypothetical protein n=1 Tax=Nostoc sp. CALU 546 TaxID=1867241 RepID=UPI003B6769DC